MRAIIGLFITLQSLLLVGCAAKPVTTKPVLINEGEIYLYVMPFPAQAERLTFTLESITAINSEGEEFPLLLSLAGLTSQETRRQRLLASGRLPDGTYEGFLFRVKEAALTTEQGEASLIIPEEPARVDFPFTVNRRKAGIIWLKFRYAESFPERFSFAPAFVASIPERQPLDVAGFVSNRGSDNVTLFDKQQKEVTGVIATGSTPAGIAFDDKQGRLYVALADEAAIGVLDVLSRDELTRIMLSRGDNVGEIALASDGRVLLSANTGDNSVSIVDTVSQFEEATINVDIEPRSLLIDPSGRRAYIFNYASNTVSVIDIGARQVIATIALESRPVRGQFNKDGDRLYIIHERSPYLVVLDTGSLSVVRREYVGMGNYSLEVDTRTDLLYVGSRYGSRVIVYDAVTFAPVDSIETEGPVHYMMIDEEENTLYLVIPERKIVTVVSLVSRRPVGTIDVNDDPLRITLKGKR